MEEENILDHWLEAFSKLFELCKIQKKENVIVLSESISRKINLKIVRTVLNQNNIIFSNIILKTMPPEIDPIIRSTGASNALKNNRKELEELKKADIIIDLTKEGLMHSKETADILASGARIMNISDEHPDILSRLKPNESLKEIVKDNVKRCKSSEQMTVISDAGTKLLVNMKNTTTVGVWGWTDKPGTLAHWPGGLVVSFPNKASVNGKLVFQPGDINLTFKKYFENEVIFLLENDYVTKIEGNNLDAKLMRNYLESFNDQEAYSTSHVGWGLNPKSRLEALTMYDKNDINGTELRALSGNFLYSIGANEFAGRFTEGHFDLPMIGCTILLDGSKIVDKGKLVNA